MSLNESSLVVFKNLLEATKKVDFPKEATDYTIAALEKLTGLKIRAEVTHSKNITMKLLSPTKKVLGTITLDSLRGYLNLGGLAIGAFQVKPLATDIKKLAKELKTKYENF